MELSTPVVRPSGRASSRCRSSGTPRLGPARSLVMEKLLDTLVGHGEPTTRVIEHHRRAHGGHRGGGSTCSRTVSAARLLGAECTISGIRPQVAQTIVSLGIEFGDIATKGPRSPTRLAASRLRQGRG